MSGVISVVACLALNRRMSHAWIIVLFAMFWAIRYVSPKCDVNGTKKCTDYYHTQEQSPMYPAAPANRGQCASPGCDCGTKPCGFYM